MIPMAHAMQVLHLVERGPKIPATFRGPVQFLSAVSHQASQFLHFLSSISEDDLPKHTNHSSLRYRSQRQAQSV